jgi:hypothetical protein
MAENPQNQNQNKQNNRQQHNRITVTGIGSMSLKQLTKAKLVEMANKLDLR